MSLASYHCSTPGSFNLILVFRMPIGKATLCRRCPGCCRRLLRLAARVPLEHAGRREFAELVADHILGDEHLGELPAVVYQEGEADEIGHDRAIACPGLDRFAAPGALLALDLDEHLGVHVGAFLE